MKLKFILPLLICSVMPCRAGLLLSSIENGASAPFDSTNLYLRLDSVNFSWNPQNFFEQHFTLYGPHRLTGLALYFGAPTPGQHLSVLMVQFIGQPWGQSYAERGAWSTLVEAPVIEDGLLSRVEFPVDHLVELEPGQEIVGFKMIFRKSNESPDFIYVFPGNPMPSQAGNPGGSPWDRHPFTAQVAYQLYGVPTPEPSTFLLTALLPLLLVFRPRRR